MRLLFVSSSLAFLLCGTMFSQTADAGKKAFDSNCSRCHGADGNGGEMGPPILSRLRTRRTAVDGTDSSGPAGERNASYANRRSRPQPAHRSLAFHSTEREPPESRRRTWLAGACCRVWCLARALKICSFEPMTGAFICCAVRGPLSRGHLGGRVADLQRRDGRKPLYLAHSDQQVEHR